MLSTPAPFPYPGAMAFVRAGVLDLVEPQPCRILQRRGDGRIQVALTAREFSAAHPDLRARASGNRTVALTDLAETVEEAELPTVAKPKPKRQRARRNAR